jgi:hypothetical protein
MHRNTIAVLLAAGLSTTAAHAQQATDARILDPQRLALMVSEAGEVTSIDYRTQAPASIRNLLEGAVRTWKFAPQLVDGKPVPWATQLDVQLVAEPIPEGYRLRVTDAVTNNLEVTRYRSPEMPLGATILKKSAMVCADVSLGIDGKTPTIETMWVNGEPVGEDDPYRRSLRRSLRGWRLEGVQIGGRRWPSGSILIPMSAMSFQLPAWGNFAFLAPCGTRDPAHQQGFRLLTPVVGLVLKPVAPTAAAVN